MVALRVHGAVEDNDNVNAHVHVERLWDRG